MKDSLLAALAIFVAWTLIDLALHQFLLAGIYAASGGLLRPLDQMNAGLIYAVTFGLIAVFIGTFKLLVRPKSLATGLALGALVGLALGIAVGFGTLIHTPIPLALAWGWFIGALVKGVVAGAIIGALIRD